PVRFKIGGIVVHDNGLCNALERYKQRSQKRFRPAAQNQVGRNSSHTRRLPTREASLPRYDPTKTALLVSDLARASVRVLPHPLLTIASAIALFGKASRYAATSV